MDKSFRKQMPDFVPTGMHFKCEDGTESNPVGPLYYVSGTKFYPVYVDTEIPNAIITGAFAAAWLDLREAKAIAKDEKLPLEIF